MTDGVHGSSAARDASRPQRVVLTDLWYHPQRPSGSARLSYDEARYLSAMGHEVWLVAQDSGSDAPECSVDGRINVLRYRRPAWARFDARPIDVHQRSTRRLLLKYVGPRVDVVHCHWLTTGAAAIDLYGGSARTCYSQHAPIRDELLASARGASLPERLRLRVSAHVHARLERRCLERCDVATTDSVFTKTRTAAIHGDALASRLRVMPGWVDLDRFVILENPCAVRARLGWPLDIPVFFSVRRLVPRMGLDRLLAAAAVLKQSGRDFHLVIAGEGPLGPALQATTGSLGLTDRVRFVGRVPESELPLMFGAADAFVLPTAALECFGLIVIESLACGRPVLATPVGAIPEILGRAEPGWLSRDAGAEAIADLLAAFLDRRLPVPDAAALRCFAEGQYSVRTRLPELAALALGTRPDRADWLDGTAAIR